jgi:cell division septum initiation protein DivIVA
VHRVAEVLLYDVLHMEITPRELRDTEIHSEIRGYSRDEVNDLLERAAQAIEAANQRVTQLQDRLTSAQSEAVRTRETEDILHRTLLLAQRAADEAVAEATAKSKQMLDEAEMSSRRMIAEGEAEARRRGETERRRLEEEILELAGRRDTLLVDAEALTRFEAEYRERMVRALESDLAQLQVRPTLAPGTRPDPRDVQMPAAVSTPAPAPAPAEPPEAPEIDEAVDAASTAAPDEAEAANTNGYDAPRRGEEPSLASDAIEDAVAADDAGGSETSEVDVSTLFGATPEPQNGAMREDVAERESAPAPRAVGTGFSAAELGDPDEIDSDILDDEAFFATLRDAVHDQAPLGPREEGEDVTGEHRFFDQDADRSSFRDVFRRRR